MHRKEATYTPELLFSLLISGLISSFSFLGKLVIRLFIKAVRPRERSKRIYRSIFRLSLELGGFAALTKGAFLLSSVAGFAILAVSCFILAAHLGESAPTEPLRG